MKARVFLFVSLVATAAHAQEFTYDPPGQLVPGSGQGRPDMTVYAPGMRFPMETGPAFANSQVWGRGGLNGGGGSQCDEENFSYPWHDNYCETRDWNMPLCPAGTGHQGQDIRAATCEKDVHWVVSAVDGRITNIGNYSVYVTAPDGTRFDYLHMSNVQVTSGAEVKRGQRLGKVSNQFNGTPTTVHLHFNIRQNVAGTGFVYVSPYMSLVASYEDLMGLRDAGPPPPPPPPAATPEPPPPEPPAAPPAEEGCACSTRAGAPATVPVVLAVALALSAIRRRRWS